MIKKILIANRGEIAVRIIKTCKELDIKTVAIYSKCDKDSYHVFLADESYCIGDNDLLNSYMNINGIIQIALKTKCDAIHPGYGFLSENHEFVRLVEENGLIFIGPSSEVMKKVSNKQELKERLKEINIPLIVSEKLEKFLINKKDLSNYPVLIKRIDGGGGKGIKIINSAKELEEELLVLKTVLKENFNIQNYYIEKYIEVIKHIEIQVISDKYQNISILPERDCSIQRDFQKIIEETPSTYYNKEIINKIKEDTLKIFKYLNYDSIGTAEFLIDKNNNYYFLEINPRIQVEHTITEEVTNIDLIEEQIKISSNLKNKRKEKILHKKHALECRINSEDPDNNFLLSSGKINFLNIPSGKSIRIDSYIYQGYYVKPYYDSLLLKIITYGKERKKVISKMKLALDELIISGIKVNSDFNYKIISQKDFEFGKYKFKNYLRNNK